MTTSTRGACIRRESWCKRYRHSCLGRGRVQAVGKSQVNQQLSRSIIRGPADYRVPRRVMLTSGTNASALAVCEGEARCGAGVDGVREGVQGSGKSHAGRDLVEGCLVLASLRGADGRGRATVGLGASGVVVLEELEEGSALLHAGSSDNGLGGSSGQEGCREEDGGLDEHLDFVCLLLIWLGKADREMGQEA